MAQPGLQAPCTQKFPASKRLNQAPNLVNRSHSVPSTPPPTWTQSSFPAQLQHPVSTKAEVATRSRDASSASASPKKPSSPEPKEGAKPTSKSEEVDDAAAVIIANLRYKNEQQGVELKKCKTNFDVLFDRFEDTSACLETQHEELKKWKLREKIFEQAESQKEEMQHSIKAKDDTIDEMREFLDKINTRLIVVEKDLKDSKKVNLDNDEKHQIEMNEMKSEYDAKIVRLEDNITSLNEHIDDLVLYQTTTDPVFILRIQIRTLLDKIRAALYKDVKGNAPEKRNRNVNTWWAHALEPSAKRKRFMDQAEIDKHRFKAFRRLLSLKGLMSDQRYIALVDSGTLEFLCQTNIDIRKQANDHAHQVNVDGLRSVLLQATTTAGYTNICSEGDMTSINGAIDFLLTAPS